MAAWWFLGFSVYGALYTLNAYRPFRFPPTLVAAFFAHWLTTELALHHVVWQAVATVVFIRLGALDHLAGWVGLGITLVSWAGLVGLVAAARKTPEILDAALSGELGEGWEDQIDGTLRELHDPRVDRFRVAFAFHMRRRECRRVKSVPYGEVRRRNLLDVWHHGDGVERAPVLVWIHGGGWMIGHKGQQALPMLNHMTARGWVCVAPNYRLSPKSKFPDHIVDVKRALAWVKDNIAEYGGDPDFVMLTGGSAGGHLASLAALTAGDPWYQPGFEEADTSVQACIPFYGVYDFLDRFESRGGFEGRGYVRWLERMVVGVSPDRDPELWRRASPIDHVGPHAPPYFVIHGDHDLLAPVGDAREFVRQLRETSRQPVVYAELPGTQHAFEVFHSIRSHHVIHAVERFGDWAFTRHLERTGAAG